MNKVVLITGATKNTGYATAKRFAKEGWNVCVTSRDDKGAQEAATRLQTEYPDVKIEGIAYEQSNVENIRAGFRRVKKLFGRLDAFIPNAAHLAVGLDSLTTTPEQWDEVMNANLRGTFFGCQEAAKLMVENDGGAIAVVSSVHANQSIPGRVAYSASKAGLNAMVRCMAVEMGHLHIRVNSLIAGAIWTERWLSQTPEQTQKRRDQYPAGKESTPEDIASALYFLCSDLSPTITGTELTVDSGISICLLPYNKHWNDKE